MSLSPALKCPLTDIFGQSINHQHFGACAKFEMRAIECLEAYGLDRGVKKCKDLLEDLKECTVDDKKLKRVFAMREERNRQIAAGANPDDLLIPDPNLGSL